MAHYITYQKYDVIAVQGPYLYKTDNPFNEYQHHYYYGEEFFPKCSDLEGNSSYDANAFYEVGGWDDEIRFGGGGIELSIRLNQLDPKPYNQIYAPICILQHDYVKDMDHLLSKREKQKGSHDRLKNKYSQWDNYVANWNAKRFDLMKIREDWTADKEEFFQNLQQEILTRNEPKINKYKQDRVFLFDIEHVLEHVNEKNREYQIAIFGAGEFGQRVYTLLKDNGYQNMIFIDNNRDAWLKKIGDSSICSPDSLSLDTHFVYIASQWREEIAAQLREKGFALGVNYAHVIR